MKTIDEPILSVDVTGRHLEISESLREHVEHHLQNVVEKYAPRPAQAKVIFTREGEGYRCDCSLHLDAGLTLQSSGEAMDIHASLSSMFARIEKRLRRYSRRLKDRHIENGETPFLSESPLSGEDEFASASENDTSGDPAIIADPKNEIEELTVAHAAIKMEMADQPVYLFRNSAHGGINLVYQRRDGNIGWVDVHAIDGKS